MQLDTYTAYCLNKYRAEALFPFNDQTWVCKVGGRIFTLASIEPFERITVKCEPNRALQLRAQYTSVTPGYHMNKRHWNTILLTAELTDAQIFEMIDHSYELVVAMLPAGWDKA